MSNGDKSYQHMVVNVVPIGEDGSVISLMLTESGEPAVYADSPPAELHAAQLRASYPQGTFRVLSFQVL